MRLAFVSVMRGAVWGGSEELWAAAAGEAMRAGHEVAISTFEWPEAAPAVRELVGRGATLIARPLRASRLSGVLSRPGWLRALGAWSPERVCLSQGGAYECVGRRSTRPILEWLRRSGVPFVNVVQYNREEAVLKAGTRRRAAELFGLAAANAFVARRNLAAAERHLGAGIPRSLVVQNPVNLGDDAPISWPADPVPSLACVGRLHTDAKGQDLLLEALGAVAWRGREWRLSVFGEGADRDRLVAMVERYRLAGKVSLRGFARDVRSIWTDHHMLVLPSREEGTPLAMVEAMLLGRPCVATDVGGAADWIEEGRSGFIAAKARVADIAAALDRAWDQRERWAELGRCAAESGRAKRDPNPGRTLLNLILGGPVRPGPAPARAS